MRDKYFNTQEGDPASLRIIIKRKVRFEEIDALGIVWHGRYSSFFEDARSALGDKYGVGYLDFYNQGIMAPIKIFHVDYHRPLSFQEEFTIEGILHWSEVARINYEYIIRDKEELVTTTGYTVQMMVDKNNDLLMVAPQFYMEFCDRWKTGQLK